MGDVYAAIRSLTGDPLAWHAEEGSLTGDPFDLRFAVLASLAGEPVAWPQ